MSDENFEKLKYLEKRLGIKKGFVGQVDIDKVT
jgi:hypothetical protein